MKLSLPLDLSIPAERLSSKTWTNCSHFSRKISLNFDTLVPEPIRTCISVAYWRRRIKYIFRIICSFFGWFGSVRFGLRWLSSANLRSATQCSSSASRGIEQLEIRNQCIIHKWSSLFSSSFSKFSDLFETQIMVLTPKKKKHIQNFITHQSQRNTKIVSPFACQMKSMPIQFSFMQVCSTYPWSLVDEQWNTFH